MAQTPRRRPKDPLLGGGSVGDPPQLPKSQIYDDFGAYGLRAFSGFVREEFLPQLMGRQAQRVYREMLDNSPVVGAEMFSILQAMRRVTWRVEPANDSSAAQQAVEFVESLMEDMSHPWEDFIVESLSMLGYGFSVHEIVYKRRLGQRPHSRPGPKPQRDMGSSDYSDGKIGWRRLPIRSQDTILKWFFDENGGVQGVTQQPYAGGVIDIPIEKLLLFRAGVHKNNPEGRSILRNAYRPYFFQKRLEEQEGVCFERLNGFPVITAPSEMIERALATDPVTKQLTDPVANAAYTQYKEIATNIRIDEQMGMVLPSDVYKDMDGKPSAARMYNLEFLTPTHGAGKVDANTAIARYKVDIMMTVLADFIQMGHEVRGTNNLAVTKVDMFYQAIEGWLNSTAAVLNRHALPRLWRLNGDNPDLMPQFKPDMAQRLDLDSLGGYVANLFTAGIPLGDPDTQMFLREAGGMPAEEENVNDATEVQQQQAKDEQDAAVALVRAKPAAAGAKSAGKKPAKAKPKKTDGASN